MMANSEEGTPERAPRISRLPSIFAIDVEGVAEEPLLDPAMAILEEPEPVVSATPSEAETDTVSERPPEPPRRSSKQWMSFISPSKRTMSLDAGTRPLPEFASPNITQPRNSLGSERHLQLNAEVSSPGKEGILKKGMRRMSFRKSSVVQVPPSPTRQDSLSESGETPAPETPSSSLAEEERKLQMRLLVGELDGETEAPEENMPYFEFLEKAMGLKDTLQDLYDRKCIYVAGPDAAGRPVVVFALSNFPTDTPMGAYDLRQTTGQRLALHMVVTMHDIVREPYSCVVLTSGQKEAPSSGWVKALSGLLGRRYHKNLKAVYIVHPAFWHKAAKVLLGPLVSSKFWSKVQVLRTLDELYELVPRAKIHIPDHVKRYDRKSSQQPPLPARPSETDLSRQQLISQRQAVIELERQLLRMEEAVMMKDARIGELQTDLTLANNTNQEFELALQLLNRELEYAWDSNNDASSRPPIAEDLPGKASVLTQLARADNQLKEKDEAIANLSIKVRELEKRLSKLDVSSSASSHPVQLGSLPALPDASHESDGCVPTMYRPVDHLYASSSDDSMAISIRPFRFRSCCLGVLHDHCVTAGVVLCATSPCTDPCELQWQRSTDRRTFLDISGANRAQYMVGPDDVGGLLRLRCTPLRNGERMEPVFVSTPPSALEPEMTSAVRSFLKKGSVVFSVLLTYGSYVDCPAGMFLNDNGIRFFTFAAQEDTILDVPHTTQSKVRLDASDGCGVHFSFADGVTCAARALSEPDRDLMVIALRTFICTAVRVMETGAKRPPVLPGMSSGNLTTPNRVPPQPPTSPSQPFDSQPRKPSVPTTSSPSRKTSTTTGSGLMFDADSPKSGSRHPSLVAAAAAAAAATAAAQAAAEALESIGKLTPDGDAENIPEEAEGETC
eukprot:Rmarinus@m.14194